MFSRRLAIPTAVHFAGLFLYILPGTQNLVVLSDPRTQVCAACAGRSKKVLKNQKFFLHF